MDYPGANLLQPIARPGSAVFDDGTGLKLYLYGGRLPDLTPTNITQIYDPVRNTWNYGAEHEGTLVQFLRDSGGQGQHPGSWRIGRELCWTN